jgi:hypothetical protein
VKFNDPKFRIAPAWIWNLGIVLLMILMIVMFARQRADDSGEQIELVCKGLEQGATQEDVQRCIENMKK